MLCKRTEYQCDHGHLTPEQVAKQAVPSTWNYCQCQAFRLDINGRTVYMLNDSLTPDNVTKYQEYAIVVPIETEEISEGVERITGVQIDSLTVNFYGATEKRIADALMRYGNSAHDEPRGRVVFTLGHPDKHKCLYCE
jgi:hypothetical protein